MKKKKKDASIKDILKGNFLVNDKDAIDSWNFICFITILAFISITSSHIIDNKINYINKLYEEIRALKSEYANVHTQLNRLQLIIKISKIVKNKNVKNLILIK